MFELEEQCQKCDYKNACYQCPAGNLDTGTRMFRPDDMCQKIVKLYIDLQEDISKKQFKKKYEVICSALEVEGENITFAKAISYLMFFFHFNYHPKLEVVHDGIYEIDDYRKMLFLWKNIISGDNIVNYTTTDFVSQIKDALTDDTLEIDEFYYFILKRGNLAPSNNKVAAVSPYQRAFFLSLLHMIILQSMHKTYEGTFSERLINDTSELSKH
jgi:hypothetical protein